MGMFDTIYVDKSINLPRPEFLPGDFDLYSCDFQTKDLDCSLETFYIRNDKLLYSVNSIKDEYDMTNVTVVPKNFTGDIRFYTYIRDIDDKNDCDFEYLALFKDGKLIDDIKLTFSNSYDNSDRKKLALEFENERLEEEKLQKRLYFPVIKFFRFTKHFIFHKLSKLSELINKLAWWIYRL
jgi:hypothetical protein